MKKSVKFLAWAVIALYVLSFFGVNASKIVPPGYRGVFVTAGYVHQQSYTNRFHVTIPFSDMYLFDIREKVYECSYQTRSSELQKIQVRGALNYSLNGDNVYRLYEGIAATDSTYQKVLFAPLLEGTLNQLVGQQSLEFISINQGMVAEAVKHVLQKELAPTELVNIYGFQLFCPEFDKDLEKAILAKAVARQETLKVEEEAKQMLLKAEAEGKALQLKSDALQNPLIVKYEVAKALGKWEGNVPQTLIIGHDALPILGTGK